MPATPADCPDCGDTRILDMYSNEITAPLNVPLLMRTLTEIHTDPTRWNQRTFFGRSGARDECGTTMCVAGWALALSGFGPELEGGYAAHAEELLGLTPLEAEHLFFHFQSRDLADLDREVKALLTRRGLLPVIPSAEPAEVDA